MEERRSIKPGLPLQHPTLSYWQDPPDSISSTRTTENLPAAADVVVIGSGISGACTAFNLLRLEPGLRILMLEARQAASGASGRNGGHTKHASYRSFVGNVLAHGRDDAAKIANLEYRCMVAVHDFIKQHKIECDSRKVDTVDVFYDKNEFANAKSGVQLMQQMIGTDTPVTDYTFHNPKETSATFRTPNAIGALSYEAGLLSAYKLTIGILKLALSKGLNLQTGTAASKIEKQVSGEDGATSWLVHTDRGVVRCNNLVLATNGYTAHLYQPLQGNVVPFRGIVTAQRPGKSMPQTGLPTTYSFVYANGYDYMITRPEGSLHEGDVVIGGGLTKGPDDGLYEFGNTDDTMIDPAITDYLKQSTEEFFSKSNWGADHPQGRIRHAWSGIMGYSADGHPFIGPVPGEKGLFLDASFQGHGMVLCFLCADAVAKMVLDQDGDELDSWLPRCFRVTQERIQQKFTGID